MKKILLSATMLLAFTSASAQFVIEHKDGKTTQVNDSKVVFTETNVSGVAYDDIASISRESKSEGFVVNFEACELPKSGYSVQDNGESTYEEGGIKFISRGYYYQYSGVYVSKKTDVCDLNSEFYSKCSPMGVIAKEKNLPGGADGSEKFAVFCYHPSAATETEFLPEFKFTDGSEHAVSSLMVNNVAFCYQLCVQGFYTKPGFAEGDYFDITFTGYDAAGKETGSVTVAMADFRDGKKLVIEDWTKVDLTPLGNVNKVSVSANLCETYINLNSDIYGICVDNITFAK